MSNQSYLQLQNLNYSVNHQKFIQNLSLKIPLNQKIALVGLNGAGKSTLIGLLTGELVKTSGSVKFKGQLPEDLDFKARSGYQASNMMPLSNISAREYLHLCYQLKGALGVSSKSEIDDLVYRWALQDILDKRMSSLSQGNMQKLAIAQAFLGRPDYIFLDEPTQALDPIEQQRFIKNVTDLKQCKLCVFSSHNINETVQIADLVIMLHQGRLVAVLDVSASDEFWLVSRLEIETIGNYINAESVELTYQNMHQKLFKLKGLEVNQWSYLVEALALEDPSIVALGLANEALMPLFNLLVNDVL